ncbi:hypothetical protein UlMin_000283 [Ulmus minor]
MFHASYFFKVLDKVIKSKLQHIEWESQQYQVGTQLVKTQKGSKSMEECSVVEGIYVTAKIGMQYLGDLTGNRSGIEQGILKTNFILEAFCNTKTSRNDNSSRFLIEIKFSVLGKICGAKIQTFIFMIHASSKFQYIILLFLCKEIEP